MLFYIQNVKASAVGNDDRMLQYINVKCPARGTHRVSNARGLPGGMLADGIDSYISGWPLNVGTK